MMCLRTKLKMNFFKFTHSTRHLFEASFRVDIYLIMILLSLAQNTDLQIMNNTQNQKASDWVVFCITFSSFFISAWILFYRLFYV